MFLNLCYEPLLYFKKLTDFLAGLNPAHAIHLLGAARLTTTNADAQQKYSSSASMLPSLQSIFEVSKSDNYGNGLLYKLKKSSFTGYLNLVPTKDGTCTIVVLWAEPKSVIRCLPHSYQSFTEIRLFKQRIFIQRLLTYVGIRP